MQRQYYKQFYMSKFEKSNGKISKKIELEKMD